MKIKLLFFIVIVTGLVFCDSERADLGDNQKTEIVFNELLSFFPDTVLPIKSEFIDVNSNQLSKKYIHFFDNDDSLIFPTAKFKIHDSLIGVIFSSAKDGFDYSLYIFDKIGNVKSSLKLISMDEFNVKSKFSIDKDYSIKTVYVFSEETYDNWYIKDGIAKYMPAHREPYHEDYEYSIKKDGSLFLKEGYLHTVKDFLLNLGVGDIEKAYKLQKNKTWGDFDKFSSTKAFGGLFEVVVYDLKISYANSKNAEVICKALYKDSVNNSAYILQDFILEKINDKWIIVDMKVNEYKRQEEYRCSKFHSSDLHLSNFTNNDFEFYLQIVSEQENNKYYGGEIDGKAVFVTKNHAVYKNEKSKIDFYIHGKDKVEIKETNCSRFRHPNVSFNGIYEK